MMSCPQPLQLCGRPMGASRHNRKEAASRQRSQNEELSFRCSTLQQALTDSEAHARGLENMLVQAPHAPAAGLGALQQVSLAPQDLDSASTLAPSPLSLEPGLV